MEKKDAFKKRIELIEGELGKATLVAVSKFKPISDLLLAYELGQRNFGENRVLELKEKAIHFENEKKADVSWHFIGHLQTNKVGTLLKIPNLKFIHSIDSLKLLEELYKKEFLLENKNISFFIEINTSGEDEKMGIRSEEELFEMMALILKNKNSHLNLIGLMTMGKIRTENFELDARVCFQKLKEKKDFLEKRFSLLPLKLSMGMSQDWKIAIEEGADYVRVGSLIFGERT